MTPERRRLHRCRNAPGGSNTMLSTCGSQFITAEARHPRKPRESSCLILSISKWNDGRVYIEGPSAGMSVGGWRGPPAPLGTRLQHLRIEKRLRVGYPPRASVTSSRKRARKRQLFRTRETRAKSDVTSNRGKAHRDPPAMAILARTR